MKTRTFSKLIAIVFAGSVLTACNGSDVEQDMAAWCDCQQKAKTDESQRETCVELMLKISDKYEFEPEAVQTIQEKAIECK
jgi:hypothetical protein